MPSQNKNGVNPTTSQPQGVKSFGEHKTPESNKKVEYCKSLNEAMAKFQELTITASKDSENPFYTSRYADLDMVIEAVSHGAQFGLSFSQAVNYETVLIPTGEFTKKLHRDIYIDTIISHVNDTATKTSRVPVLIEPQDESKSQKMGSGITYAKRYALQAIYGLATDDDANAADDKSNPKSKFIPPISTNTSNGKSSRGGF